MLHPLPHSTHPPVIADAHFHPPPAPPRELVQPRCRATQRPSLAARVTAQASCLRAAAVQLVSSSQSPLSAIAAAAARSSHPCSHARCLKIARHPWRAFASSLFRPTSPIARPCAALTATSRRAAPASCFLFPGGPLSGGIVPPDPNAANNCHAGVQPHTASNPSSAKSARLPDCSVIRHRGRPAPRRAFTATLQSTRCTTLRHARCAFPVQQHADSPPCTCVQLDAPRRPRR